MHAAGVVFQSEQSVYPSTEPTVCTLTPLPCDLETVLRGQWGWISLPTILGRGISVPG